MWSGFTSSADEIARLHERTEGWAAGLQLAGLSLRGREDHRQFIDSFAGDDQQIVDYLGFEVLDSEPPELREFMIQSSVLERLSGPLCAAVTGNPDAERLLRRLERGQRVRRRVGFQARVVPLSPPVFRTAAP